MICSECERLRHEEAQATIQYVEADTKVQLVAASPVTDSQLKEWEQANANLDEARKARDEAVSRRIEHQRTCPIFRRSRQISGAESFDN